MAPPLVLHLLPVDLSRGAQTYAREIRDGLDGPEVRHRTLTLFASEGGALQPDESLAVPGGLLRRAGLDPRAGVRLRRVLVRDTPALVVAHGSEPLKYAVLAGVPRRRLVGYKIGAGHTRLTGVRGRVYRTLLSRSGVTAAVSQAAAAEAADYGVPAERLRVIPNGREPGSYAFPRAGRPPGTPARLVWIGHLDAAKRPLRFVELVAELRNAGVEVTATVAGAGPLLEAVRQAVRNAGLDAVVTVAGNVDDVPALLADSDILVLTSAPNEGMPGVLIEAGMAGLPVVTTAVPGAADVVVDGETGCVVGVDDFDALVEATRTLVDEPDRRDGFGRAARARCEAHFSIEACLRGWKALVDELLAAAEPA